MIFVGCFAVFEFIQSDGWFSSLETIGVGEVSFPRCRIWVVSIRLCLPALQIK
uniref:Uncharacterized protein n=1 Tax=Anguilla anguilla TaxID=7936 RepID=A0A0E9TC90_ANGAN